MDYLHAAELKNTNIVKRIKIGKEHSNDVSPSYKTWASKYLTGFKIFERIYLVIGFEISIRKDEHSAEMYKDPLTAGTVNKTMTNMVTSFSDNNIPDPRLLIDRHTDRYLHSIIKPFKVSGPKYKQQKVIIPELLAYVYSRPKDDMFAQHVADLYNGHFFFACQSCKYLIIQGVISWLWMCILFGDKVLEALLLRFLLRPLNGL